MWNLAAPPGFQGLRDDKAVTVYVRHLPHWRQDGATYFATFRLYDSLPQSKLRELAAWRSEWERRHPSPRSEGIWQQFSREVMRRIETSLDQGLGSCVLKQPNASDAVAAAMHEWDGDRYELCAYVVMPNHVHLLVRPLQADVDSLERILKRWKGATGRQINAQLARSGTLWQAETFDRIVRDEEHLYRCVQYIGANAGKAGLAPHTCRRWVRPEWAATGWDFTPG